MRKSALLTAVLASSLIVAGCGGGGGGGGEEPTISGVWTGSYTAQLSSAQTSYTPQGPICLELTQNGAQVSGKGWVSGYLWGNSFSGTVSGNNFSGTISGQDLGGNNVNVSFSGTITSNQISGTVTVNSSATYNISLTKDTSKSNCGWADRNVALAFGNALGGAVSNDPNNPNPLGYLYASFITEVPKVNVKVDATEKQDWWACVWEIRDNITNNEMTLGAVISPDLQELTGWVVDDGSTDIGLDASNNALSFTNPLGPLGSSDAGAFYFNTTTSLVFSADNSGDDEYFNKGTQLGQPFYVSPCMSGNRYTVYMTNLPFYLKFSGTGHSFETPPNPSNTNYNTIPSLYIEINSCP